MEEIVEPVIVRLIQLLAFAVTAGRQCFLIGGGRRVNLVKSGPIRHPRLRAEAITRPDVPHTALTVGQFAQQDGSGWIANHRSWITLCPPIGERITRLPVNSDTMAVRLG